MKIKSLKKKIKKSLTSLAVGPHAGCYEGVEGSLFPQDHDDGGNVCGVSEGNAAYQHACKNNKEET